MFFLYINFIRSKIHLKHLYNRHLYTVYIREVDHYLPFFFHRGEEEESVNRSAYTSLFLGHRHHHHIFIPAIFTHICMHYQTTGVMFESMLASLFLMKTCGVYLFLDKWRGVLERVALVHKRRP